MGTPMRIFDTAGMRKRARVTEKLEKLSVADGLRAVRFAEVVVVLLDVEIPFETQDLRIADFAETEGRAVVIAVNKWDTEDDKSHKLNEMRASFEKLLPQLRGAPLITVSAKTGKGLRPPAQRRHQGARGLEPPRADRPPESVAGCDDRKPSAPGPRRPSHPPALHDAGQDASACVHREIDPYRPDPTSYQRYLINGLRTDFDMPGTPIACSSRSGRREPYKAKATKIVQSGALSKHKHRQKPKGS